MNKEELIQSLSSREEIHKNNIKQYKKELKQLQSLCNHPKVCECDYLPMEFFSSLPPRRICEVCGLEEEGWGCGYKVLTTEYVKQVSRDKFYSLRKCLEVL